MRRIISRRRFTKIKQDKVVLCYRDSATNALFTWDLDPTIGNIEVYFPNSPDPHVFDPIPALNLAAERQREKYPEDSGLVTNWAIIVGFFKGYVQMNLEHSKHPEVAPTIDEMEKQFKGEP